MSDLVSIIIPCYNSQQFIRETLDSVAAQTYRNWECIVVDDGSTDGTEEIVENHFRSDARIRFFHRSDERIKGANTCRNYGFELSRGDYIIWVDSDDILISNKIEFQFAQLKRTGCQVSVSQASRFKDENKTPFRNWRDGIVSDHLTEDLISGVVGWHTSSPLWSRNLIPDRPFNETLQGAQEWYFHILQSIRIPGSSFHFSEYSTVLIRESMFSMTYSTNIRQRAANYLDARTALMHELYPFDPRYVQDIADTARKLLKRIGNDPLHQESIVRFADALFLYDKPRWLKLRGISSFMRVMGTGERLFNYF